MSRLAMKLYWASVRQNPTITNNNEPNYYRNDGRVYFIFMCFT
jgi:hypothetical protein